MTSKADYQTHQTKKRLQRYGVNADPKHTRIDAGETELHVASRALCGLVLARAGHAFDIEVKINDAGDRIDVLDFGGPDEHPIALEFESAPTKPTIETKLDKYVRNGPCRDCIVFDLRDAPTDIDELTEWIEGQLAL